MQKTNRTNVYQIFRHKDGLTKRGIVQRLQLSIPTIIQNINGLLKEGLIVENGYVSHTGVRRVKSFSKFIDST